MNEATPAIGGSSGRQGEQDGPIGRRVAHLDPLKGPLLTPELPQRSEFLLKLQKERGGISYAEEVRDLVE